MIVKNYFLSNQSKTVNNNKKTLIMKQKKNIVVGLGEIGKPILKLFSKHDLVLGYDVNPKLMNKKIFEQFSSLDTLFLHVCIPFNEKFI